MRIKEQLNEILDKESSDNNHRSIGKDGVRPLVADNSPFNHNSNEDMNKF